MLSTPFSHHTRLLFYGYQKLQQAHNNAMKLLLNFHSLSHYGLATKNPTIIPLNNCQATLTN